MLKVLLLFYLSFSFSQYNLDTCETDISPDVPDFFQKYFQCVTIRMSESGEYVNLYYNGLAPYDSWYYQEGHPNAIPWESLGQGYFQIPNAYIEDMDYVISIPVNPVPRPDLVIDAFQVDGEVTQTGVTYEYPMGSVGSALNGVNMFNPCASPPDIIEDEAYTFDLYSGHPAGSSGIYHYHTTSSGPLEVLQHKMSENITSTTPGDAEIELYGIMCDGTVVMGCTELDGSGVNASDWDAQNGHVHDIIDEDGTLMFEDRYHTHICYDTITEQDIDGNGYQEHEFTPEISYYQTLGMGVSFERCEAMSSPIEPDADDQLSNESTLPYKGGLSGVYPNPFNPSTTIEFNVPYYSNVSLDIFDLKGNKISNLADRYYSNGSWNLVWDAAENSSGIYIARMQIGNQISYQKLMLIK